MLKFNVEPKFNLITSFYLVENQKRQNELNICLKKNIYNKYTEKIHLFLDDNISLEYLKKLIINYPIEIKKKINICKINKQPLYSDLFKYANKLKNKLCMICNSDIWLYSILDKTILNKLITNTVFSLTRYENDLSHPLIDKYMGSHDSFIFKSPLNPNIIKHLQFKQNTLGSENVVMYELNKHNYKIINCCYSIITVHEHKSNIRNWGKRINTGDIDGNNIFKIRNFLCKPTGEKLSINKIINLKNAFVF